MPPLVVTFSTILYLGPQYFLWGYRGKISLYLFFYMSLSHHLAAQWVITCFSRGRTTLFQFPTPPRVFMLQHPTFAGVHINIMRKKLWRVFFFIFWRIFYKNFLKNGPRPSPKNVFFCNILTQEKKLDKKSEKSHRNFIPTGLVKFGAKSVACTMKTEGGVGIWVSKTYARIRAGRHAGRGVVRLADVDFFFISNFMVKWC